MEFELHRTSGAPSPSVVEGDLNQRRTKDHSSIGLFSDGPPMVFLV